MGGGLGKEERKLTELPSEMQFGLQVPKPDLMTRRSLGLRSARFRALAILVFADMALLLLAFFLATHVRNPGALGTTMWLTHALQLVPFFLVVGLYNETYSFLSLASYRLAFKKVAITIAVAASLRLFMTFGVKNTGDFSRAIFIMAIACGTVFLFAVRAGVISILRKRFGRDLTNILVVEAGGAPVPIENAHRLVAADWGFKPALNDPVMLDRFGRATRDMDRVIVSCALEDRRAWAFVLKGLNVRGEVVSHGLHDLGALSLHREESFTSLTVSTGSLGLKDRALKRALDLALTVPAVIILSPVYLLIAATIKLEDGGPIFFVQERTGRANCLFRMLKFRSMGVEESDYRGDRSAALDDDRVTRVGRFIRRTSLDELPQLLNVLVGDMSLVGPRPHALGSRAGGKLFWEIDSTYWHRHSLKPGLTGLAQVRGHRGATDHEIHLRERLSADLEYLNDWSPWRDIVIILTTVKVLIHDRAF